MNNPSAFSPKNLISNIRNDCINGEITKLSTWQRIFESFKYLYVVFWITSLAGHYLEIVWAYFNHYVLGSYHWMPQIMTVVPLAAPYGIGAVAVVLFVWPYIKSGRIGPFTAFLACTVVTAIVEYLSALFLVIFVGYNHFWDYSSQPFNINGYICLENSLLFGLASAMFLYLLYPHLKKFIQHFKKHQLDVIFWILFISYMLDLIFMK